MRVIAGSAKGRRLSSVPGTSTRPITDRVKESLFNILGAFVVDARVLDLFAGTGSVGIEALSRGAALAVFVERDRRARQVVQRNLELTGLAGRGQVVGDDVFHYVARPPAAPFDLVYVAPPQYQGLWEQTLRAIDRTGVTGEDGLVVAQIHPKEYVDLALQQMRLEDQRRYGSTMLCFYRLVTIP